MRPLCWRGYFLKSSSNFEFAINVEAIDDKMPTRKFPKVTKRVGKNSPQYEKE